MGFGGEDGSVVISGSYDATVRLWDCKSQSTKPIQVLEEAKDSVSSLHVVGHEIVTGSVDGRMRVYDVRMGMLFVDVIGCMYSLPTQSRISNRRLLAASITSVQQTRDGNAVLVSTLDSTVRLMDKSNGQLLQKYRGHTNKDYRIRSCLGMADSAVMSGSEDGKLYAWDLLEGKVIEKLEAHGGKVASAVACNGVRKEWASAGVDGKCLRLYDRCRCRLRVQKAPSVFGPCQSDTASLGAEELAKDRWATDPLHMRSL